MLYLSLLLLSLDQLLKYLIPTLNPPLWLIENKIGIMLSHNTGAAFSLPLNTSLTIPVAIITIILFTYWYYQSFKHNKIAVLTTALIISGTAGNLIDRILNGYVVDFIKIFSWPTFNVADAYISIGFILLILFLDTIKLQN
jgi:signal peptidase II